MNNNYYIYIYWRLDINEPFYVGKGKGRRWKRIDKSSRGYNKHFINIVNKIPVVVTIEKDSLTEFEALYWEEKIIETLVFEYGFSIDIKRNNSKNHYCHLVNQTWGGEGVSGFTPSKKIRELWSEQRKGENNGMYGKGFLLEGKKNGRANSVICLTTKRIFYTAKEGGEYYGIKNARTICACCRGYEMRNGERKNIKTCGKLSDGTPLIWKFLVWKHNKKYRIKEEY